MRKKESNRKTQIEKILKFSFINKDTKHLTYSLSLKVVRGLVICKLINERHARISRGWGVRTYLEFAKLNIADFTGNEKISNFSYLCTSTVKRQGCPPPWKNFLDPRLKEEHEMKRKLIRERRMFLSIFHS